MAAISESLRMIAGEQKPSNLTFSRASQGTRVNKIGHIETMATDEVRMDYYPSMSLVGVRRGYLLEEASTNMLLQSSDFSTTWAVDTAATLTNLGGMSANGTDFMSPDGLKTGDYLNAASTGTGIVAARQTGLTFTNGTKYTVSVWARKSLGYDYLEISNLDNDAAGRTFAKTFNLSTGAVGTAGNGADASGMDEYSGGWYRCWVTFTADASSAGEIYFKARNDDDISTTSAHTAGNKIHLWGAQCEALAYMTSYVPTTTSTVARAADVALISATDDAWNWNAGVSMWCDYVPLNTTETVTPIFHYADSTNANYMTLLSDGKVRVVSNSESQLASDPFDAGIGLVSKTQYRGLMSMKINHFHYSSNGVLSANLPDTSITVPLKTGSSNYSAKFFHGTGYANSGSGWLKGFEIYPQALATIDMQNRSIEVNTDLSTIQISSSGTVSDNTVSESKLMAGSVTETKIGASAVTEGKLADGAVTGNKLGNDSIAQNHIQDNAIQNEHILDNAITSSKIAFDVIVADDIANNAITVAELSNDAVETAKIKDLNVTRAKLANDVIDGTKIADDAVDSEHLAAGGIDSEHIANDAVDSQHYAAGSIDAEHIANDAVDSQHYADGSIDTAHIGDLQVTVDKVGSNAITTAKIVDLNVTNAKLAADSVTTAKIVDGNITSAKIAAGQINASHIADGTVVEAELADNSVTANKLADDSVDTAAIVDANVTEAKIADGAVTNAKLGANSITSDKIALDIIVAEDLAANSVTFAEIQDGAVRLAKIQDGAVDGTKIELTGNAHGDIMYYDGTDWVRLEAVESCYLQSNGAGAAPSWVSSSTLAIALG